MLEIEVKREQCIKLFIFLNVSDNNVEEEMGERFVLSLFSVDDLLCCL